MILSGTGSIVYVSMATVGACWLLTYGLIMFVIFTMESYAWGEAMYSGFVFVIPV